MNFNEYQAETDKTALFPRENGMDILYPVLGLCGESGEVAEKVKKIFRDSNGVITEEVRQAIKKELGDVMWYISQSCRAFGFTMEEVAISNIKKLEERQKKNTINGSGDNR
jgi:NTP pyrophosphatase (non-canonical NTP hydrolase)